MSYAFKHDIVERTVEYSIMVIQVYHKIQRSDDGRIIGRQLLKSATSIGANVHDRVHRVRLILSPKCLLPIKKLMRLHIGLRF